MPKVIFVIGGSSARKETQCAKLLKNYQQLDSYSLEIFKAKMA